MERRKRRIGIVLLLLFVLIVPPVWSVYREFRQARLDHALIQAIKAGNNQKALEALAEGASGEARDTGELPTFREIVASAGSVSTLRAARSGRTPPCPVVAICTCQRQSRQSRRW